MRPSRKDMEIIDEEQFPNLFSQCDLKKKKRIVSPARNTIFSIFELAHAVQNDTFKMPSQHEKCKKNTGFSAFHLANDEKKLVDSSRAASQPIPLFSCRFITCHQGVAHLSPSITCPGGA